MSLPKTLLLGGCLGIAWLVSSSGWLRAQGPASARPAAATASPLQKHSRVSWSAGFSRLKPGLQLGFALLAAGDDRGDKLPHKDAFRRLGTVRFRNGDGILSLAYSPSGKILASGGRNDPVRLWDAQTGQLLRQLDDQWTWALAFSPSGKQLATAGANKIIRLWDVDTGKELTQMKGHTATIKSLAFSSDGGALASGSDDNTVRLWKADGTPVAEYKDHTFGVNAVAISPDTKHFASGSTDRTVRVWEYAAKHVVIHSPAAVTGVAYLPNRKTLVTAGDDGFIRVWDIGTAKQLRGWKGHDNTITHLSLSQDGNTLATASLDRTVQVWNVATGASIAKIACNAGDGDAMAMTRDGTVIAVGGLNSAIRCWNAATGKPLAEPTSPEGPVTAVACSADGSVAAAGFSTNQVVLFDLPGGKEKSRLSCGGEDAEVLLAFSGDGRTLATASAPDKIILWDVASAKEKKRLVLAEPDEIRCLASSPDGLKLAVGYTSGGLRIWDISTGKVVKQLPIQRGARAVAYSRDGKLLAVGSEDVIALFDTTAYQPDRQFSKLNDTIACLAFAPDGRTLAAGMFANSIQLFDLTKDKLDGAVRVLEGHRGVVNGLAWSTNGRCLVSAGFDKTVRTWEFVNGLPIATWQGHRGEATAVALHPSGRMVISGSRDTTVLLWDMTRLGFEGRLPEPKPMAVGSLDVMWKELASNDNAKGNEAMWSMVGAKDGAKYLANKVFLTDPTKIKLYLEHLDSSSFKVREKAFLALAGYERWIEDVLRQALQNPPSEEVRQRVKLLLKRLEGQQAITLQQERLRVRRIIEILEQGNTPAGRDLLRDLEAGAAEEDLRDMARAALERVSKRP